jgi:hypothetical protein
MNDKAGNKYLVKPFTVAMLSSFLIQQKVEKKECMEKVSNISELLRCK